MCEDSRVERQYWMHRVEQLRKQMEQEELGRQGKMAVPRACPAPGTGPGDAELLPVGMQGRRHIAWEGWTMRSIVAGVVVALSILLFSARSPAATFVYVSNADGGDIGMYTLQSDGSLKPGARYKAEKVVMPLSVSPDKRFLVAAVRSKPFSAYTYSIERATGMLTLVGTSEGL